MLIEYVTEPVRINHVSAKNANFLSLLYHNLLATYINEPKSLPLLQKLMGFLLQFTNRILRTFRTKDVSKNITWCNLNSHG